MSLSVVFATTDETGKLKDALASTEDIADEVVILDLGKDGDVQKLAKKYNARVVKHKPVPYVEMVRNRMVQEAKKEWVLLLDPDERIIPELAREIKSLITDHKSLASAYAVPRRNFILGREMRHGGWWPDYVRRLFKKEAFIDWPGQLHEAPRFKGDLGYLENPMLHLKHNNLSEMIEKTNRWSEIEAELLLKAGHPKMSWWRFMRIMLTELWQRLFVKRGFLDGTEGVIYAIYQMWSRFITYAKLWEMQNARSNS